MVSREHLAVKIALLSLVNDLPEQPSIAKFPPSKESRASEASRSQNLSLDHSGKTFDRMPLKYELLATQHLSYISAYSNNPLHVLALACHEVQDQIADSGNDGSARSNRIMIRLAANSGLHDGLLKQLKVIARILQDEANGTNRDTNSERLLQEVIRLNHRRILSRLRSRHARYHRPGSPIPLYKRLETAKTLLCRMTDASSTSMKQLMQNISNLISQMIRIEDMETAKAQSSACESHLLELINDMHEFMRYHKQDISRLDLNFGNWNKEATNSLLDRFRKLAHYINSCEVLLKTARRSSAFANIVVEFVNLQERTSPISKSSNAGNLNIIIDESCTKKNLSRVAAYLRVTEGTIRTHLHDLLRDKYKLHAEMQLVKFYDRFPSSRSPRVIWSTKSACYLCHTFLKAHGRYYLPNTHGKLYHAWHYPLETTSSNKINYADGCVINLQGLSLEFSRVIDRKLQDYLQNKIKPRRSDCVESKVDLLAVLTPSILSLQSQRVNDRINLATTVSEAQHLDRPAPATSNDFCHASSKNSASEISPMNELLMEGKEANTTDAAVANTAAEISHINSRKALLGPQQHNVAEEITAKMVASDAEVSCSEVEACDLESSIKSEREDYRLLKMQFGDTMSHIFHIYTNRDNNDDDDGDDNDDKDDVNERSKILRIHAPGVHINLQHFAMPLPRADEGDRSIDVERQQLLHIEISCLDLSSHKAADGSLSSNSRVYDFDDELLTTEKESEEEEEERHLPRDILYSASGLLLKHRSTALCLRARLSGKR